MNGAFPICHMGCALRVWLVVTGQQRAHLWRDGRAEYSGLSPIFLKGGSPADFSPWYMEWLEDALQASEPVNGSAALRARLRRAELEEAAMIT